MLSFNRNSHGDIALYMILIFVIAGAFSLVGMNYSGVKQSKYNFPTNIIFEDSPSEGKNALQLRTPRPVTPTPTTVPPTTPPTIPPVVIPPGTGGCPPYTKVDGCICNDPPHQQNLFCNGKNPGNTTRPSCFGKSDPACINMKNSNPTCEWYCMGKPVIYLYPTKKTLVDVKLTIPGRIYISIPEYPDSGWKNVEAYPNGKLTYKGKEYKNLYYESEVKDVKAPKNGIFIKTTELKKELTSITTKLGLIKTEQDEFLEYWLPKLYELNSPYILFSLLDPKEKDRVDHVEIFPKPDTFIEFLAYFKKVKQPYEIPGLELPKTIPERIGFTAVEWGGTIEMKN